MILTRNAEALGLQPAPTPVFLPFHMDWSGIEPGPPWLGYGNSPLEQV
jgi:hypothetical protein